VKTETRIRSKNIKNEGNEEARPEFKVRKMDDEPLPLLTACFFSVIHPYIFISFRIKSEFFS
jgi:hypothetical protein